VKENRTIYDRISNLVHTGARARAHTRGFLFSKMAIYWHFFSRISNLDIYRINMIICYMYRTTMTWDISRGSSLVSSQLSKKKNKKYFCNR